MSSRYILFFAVVTYSAYLITGWPQVLGKPKRQCEDGHKCGAGQGCYMKEVECKDSHCPKVPSCRPSCDVIRCRGGYVCKSGECVQEPFNKCALVLCEKGTHCRDGKCYRGPTCGGTHCNSDEECVLEQVQCFVEPCPPIPSCRPIIDDKCARIDCCSGYICVEGECVKQPTCDGYKCVTGEECYLHQDVRCVKAPCLPVPACRPILTCDTINCITGYICKDKKCIPDSSNK